MYSPKVVLKAAQSELDERRLLNESVLVLSANIEVAQIETGRLIVRNTRSLGTLVVDSLQWSVLQHFNKPAVACNLIPTLLEERCCPALADYFELIIQACAEGILNEQGTEEPLVKTNEWSLVLRPAIALSLVKGSVLVALVALALSPIDVPKSLLPLLSGYLLSCAGLSLGSLLGACYMAGFGHPLPTFRMG